MGGIFGVVSEGNCAKALLYGTDYHSHLGTENAGLAVYGNGGFSHAIGYAMESGLPYRRPLVKYTPGYGRSYTPPSQDIRDLVATMKLCAVRDVIRGGRMVMCDDSIVRGTQLKNYTIRKLWDNGAKEIHIRPACPPPDVSLPIFLFHEDNRRTGFPPVDPHPRRRKNGMYRRLPGPYVRTVPEDDRVDPAGSERNVPQIHSSR